MAKVEYQFPVDKIHGKIAKQHKIGFAHRVASKLNYTTTYGQRTTPFTETELAWRTKFATISRMVTARMQDPSKMVEDQQAFREQTEYDTMRKYLWHLIAEELEG